MNWLRAFEAAARHLSFTQAAELNVTQSAVSQHVRSLEAFLGRELFIRRTRALHLTEAGANYLPTIREAFGLLASGTRAFRGGDRGKSLLVQCNLAFSVFWLAPRLAGLLEAHPWLLLNLTTPIWDPERSARSAEMEIRYGRPGEMSDAAIRIAYDHYYPVCRPGYAEGDSAWTRSPLFDCSGVMENWETWLASQGRRMPAGKQIHLGSTYVVSVGAALHGAGLAMAHDTVASDLLDSGALARPCAQVVPMSAAYFLTAPPRHGETPASRAFIQWILGETARSGTRLRGNLSGVPSRGGAGGAGTESAET
ncbi:MAG: LysR family transcriptional regulator [Chromatiales bacterium]|nr:LysR family transcriptional regulator [Chromatiales bacterium]